MKNAEQNLKLSVIVAENANPKQRELADWLVTALADLDVEAHLGTKKANEEASCEERHEQGVEDEGAPKTPLPDKEEPSSSKGPAAAYEGTFDEDDWDDCFLDPELSVEREVAKERTRGFLTGLFTAWLVTGTGVLLLHLIRSGLRWLSGLTDIPFDVLIGLGMLAVLALFFMKETRQLAARLIDWFDFDF